MKPLFLYPLKLNTYRIIDGDTVEVLLDRGFNETKKVSVRFSGLNAPETRTRRAPEKEAGLLVKKVVEHWLLARKDATFYATSEERPKYANRIVGKFWSVVTEGWPWQAGLYDSCLNDFLLELEIVKPYTGGKREFTDEELQGITAKCNAFLETNSTD
jgi:hypothetical protein